MHKVVKLDYDKDGNVLVAFLATKESAESKRRCFRVADTWLFDKRSDAEAKAALNALR